LVLSVFRKVTSTIMGARPSLGNQGIDFDEVIARLQLAKMEVDRLKEQLVNEISGYYDKMVEAARVGDSESLELTAAEVVLKKKILTSVITYSKLLALAIQRLRDARDVETMVKVLAPLEYVMRAADDYLATISPETVMKINSVLEATERVIRSTQVTASLLPIARTELDPEVREEIAKAVAEANKESDSIVAKAKNVEVTAKVESSQSSLEEELLKYIKASGGIINITKAAKDLNTTTEVVKAALETLQSKGLIKIHRKHVEVTTA